jgi:hypothetical protein
MQIFEANNWSSSLFYSGTDFTNKADFQTIWSRVIREIRA